MYFLFFKFFKVIWLSTCIMDDLNGQQFDLEDSDPVEEQIDPYDVKFFLRQGRRGNENLMNYFMRQGRSDNLVLCRRSPLKLVHLYKRSPMQDLLAERIDWKKVGSITSSRLAK